ncbi:MAG TPA: SRPBCC family protein [Thermoanaerobaculia bacterium]|nr:SRPBCC family protein [Thermoanaerobaculia bacterium]
MTIDTWIVAPVGRCFDAARDLDLHMRSVAHTGERAVAGRTSGLIGHGEEVTWRARHFGIVQRFTSRITAFDPPRHFQDSMMRGAFRTFVHDHYFDAIDGRTRMRDVLAFSAPLGLLGLIAERLVLRRYMTRLLTMRAAVIKDECER